MELQQYREDSDSVLSFVKECCIIAPDSVTGSTDLFAHYRSYCSDCGIMPYSQKKFIQQLLVTVPAARRGVDKRGKKRVIEGIRLEEEDFL